MIEDLTFKNHIDVYFKSRIYMAWFMGYELLIDDKTKLQRYFRKDFFSVRGVWCKYIIAMSSSFVFLCSLLFQAVGIHWMM